MTTDNVRLTVSRMLALADFLARLHPDKFAMSWTLPRTPNKHDKRGCALWWASTVPELRKSGLGVSKTAEGLSVMSYEARRGVDAVRAFFGLSVSEVWDVFTPDGYDGVNPAPLTVACRLRRIANSRGA